MDYVELGAHSAYSFLHATGSPRDLAQQAAKLGYNKLALTDIGGVYATARFQREAQKTGIDPIVGALIPLSDGSRLRFLCESAEGYHNLCTLCTHSHVNTPKGKPCLHPHEVEGLTEGLHALWSPPATLPCLDKTRQFIAYFAPGRLYVEIHRHLDRHSEYRCQQLLHFAQSSKLPAVVTNDVRHCHKSDKALADVLQCISQGSHLDTMGRQLFPNAQRSLKSPQEMCDLFQDQKKALTQSVDIAHRCEFRISQLTHPFPIFVTPHKENAHAFLQELAQTGAIRRYGKITAPVQAQLKRELHLIDQLHLSGYFLVVWDIIRFCREHHIFVQGRGSAANSTLCYVLEITAVDPMRLGLLFERFLSEQRKTWPDIDLDLPSGAKRELVIQYVYKRYGPHGAALAATFNTFQHRSALREVGKALGIEAELIDDTARHLRHHLFTQGKEHVFDTLRHHPLKASRHPRFSLWMSLSKQALDTPRHLGQHSGGMVIRAGRLDQVCPFEPATMPGRHVIQWDKDDCAQEGLIKVDLLGLGILSALEHAQELIRVHEHVEIDCAKLPIHDPKVYQMIAKGDTVGVFQLESRAQMATLTRLQPTRFYDLVVSIALIRPGPIGGKMVHPYLRRRRGQEEITYPDPCLQPILERTLGIPIFQEQVMRIAMVAADFSGQEADNLRQAMGFRRFQAEFPDLAERLQQGMTRNKIPPSAQKEIIDFITAFAAYGFPESHSASFALLAFASAYLKRHHPAAFLAALLNAYPMGCYSPHTLVKDAQRHGVRVMPIDISRSEKLCTLESKTEVRLGLRWVKGLNNDAIQTILHARQVNAFVSLKDFASRVPLPQEQTLNLAELGAFAPLGHTRRDALWQLGSIHSARDFPLLQSIENDDDELPLHDMTLEERIAADIQLGHLSVGSHPLALWRKSLHNDSTSTAAQLKRQPTGRFVSVAGYTISRQRPGSAKGVMFWTLEDETGLSNLVLRPQKLREGSLESVANDIFVIAEGRLQRHEGVIQVDVSNLYPGTQYSE
jgi:error-prone DNA polymerase